MEKHRSSVAGFSLFEVMMALTLFSVFIAAFVMSQGFNVNDSIALRDETEMLHLAQSVMNQTLINPPDFNNSLENQVVEKNFEAPYSKYRYTLKFKRLTVPSLSSFLGVQGEEQQQQQDQNDQLQGQIFDVIQRNLEEMLWQVRVTVLNKETEMQFTLSTWLRDYTRRVDTSGF